MMEESISRKEGIKNLSKKVNKSVWGMPRLSMAKKDVKSCEKLRGCANSRRSVNIRMGEPK